jgi:hypothetical protein
MNIRTVTYCCNPGFPMTLGRIAAGKANREVKQVLPDADDVVLGLTSRLPGASSWAAGPSWCGALQDRTGKRLNTVMAGTPADGHANPFHSKCSLPNCRQGGNCGHSWFPVFCQNVLG